MRYCMMTKEQFVLGWMVIVVLGVGWSRMAVADEAVGWPKVGAARPALSSAASAAPGQMESQPVQQATATPPTQCPLPNEPLSCTQQFAVFATTTVINRPDNAWAKGYPLAAIRARQPYLAAGEFGKLLPGNIEIVVNYVNWDNRLAPDTKALVLTIYPLTGTVTANDLARTYPLSISIESHTQSACSGPYQPYYEMTARTQRQIVVGRRTYCMDSAWWAVLPIEGDYFYAVTEDGCWPMRGESKDTTPAYHYNCAHGGGTFVSMLVDQPLSPPTPTASPSPTPPPTPVPPTPTPTILLPTATPTATESPSTPTPMPMPTAVSRRFIYLPVIHRRNESWQGGTRYRRAPAIR